MVRRTLVRLAVLIPFLLGSECSTPEWEESFYFTGGHVVAGQVTIVGSQMPDGRTVVGPDGPVEFTGLAAVIPVELGVRDPLAWPWTYHLLDYRRFQPGCTGCEFIGYALDPDKNYSGFGYDAVNGEPHIHLSVFGGEKLFTPGEVFHIADMIVAMEPGDRLVVHPRDMWWDEYDPLTGEFRQGWVAIWDPHIAGEHVPTICRDPSEELASWCADEFDTGAHWGASAPAAP